MKSISEIHILSDLSVLTGQSGYTDFHNDCCSQRFRLMVSLHFEKLDRTLNLVLRFWNVEMTKVDCLSDIDRAMIASIDTLYRGRYEKDGKLIDLSGDGKGYFYLDFVEGLSMEILASGISFTEEIVIK